MKPQPSLKCVQAVPAYKGVKYNLRRTWRRVGERFDEISCTCRVAVAVKISGANGHQTLAEEKPFIVIGYFYDRV